MGKATSRGGTVGCSVVALVVALLATGLGGASTARADADHADEIGHARVALGPGTDACPDATTIDQAYAEQLSTPLAASEKPLIGIDRDGETYVARITVRGRVRVLRSPDCAELASSAAWVAALAAASHAGEPPDAVSHEAEPVVTPPPPPVSRPAAAEPPRLDRGGDRARQPSPDRSLEIPVTASALLGRGYFIPELAAGMALGSGIRGKWWALLGEARLYPKLVMHAQTTVGEALVRFSLFMPTVLPCFRWAPVKAFAMQGCGSVAAGANIGHVEGRGISRSSVGPIVYLGGRSTVEVRPIRQLSFGLGATLEWAAVATQITSIDGGSFSGSPLGGAGSFDTSVVF